MFPSMLAEKYQSSPSANPLAALAGSADARRGDGRRRHGIGIGGIARVGHCVSSSVDMSLPASSRSISSMLAGW